MQTTGAAVPATPQPAEAAAQPYPSVSLAKFTVLWFCSLGLYGIYWFYMQWQAIKERERLDIIPALRAIFQIFFCYSLFDRVNAHARTLGLGPGIAAGPLAAGFIVLSLLWRLPDPYWLVSMLSFLFLLPAQHLINRINASVAPQQPLNDRFSTANVVLIVVGGMLWALALFGTFVDPEAPPAEPDQRPAPRKDVPIAALHEPRHA
jgi:uncharacterized membrane protein